MEGGVLAELVEGILSLLSWWTLWWVLSLLSWWRVVPLLELVDSLEGGFLAELVEVYFPC